MSRTACRKDAASSDLRPLIKGCRGCGRFLFSLCMHQSLLWLAMTLLTELLYHLCPWFSDTHASWVETQVSDLACLRIFFRENTVPFLRDSIDNLPPRTLRARLILFCVTSPQLGICLEPSCLPLLLSRRARLPQVTFSTAHLPTPPPPL